MFPNSIYISRQVSTVTHVHVPWSAGDRSCGVGVVYVQVWVAGGGFPWARACNTLRVGRLDLAASPSTIRAHIPSTLEAAEISTIKGQAENSITCDLGVFHHEGSENKNNFKQRYMYACAIPKL